jgi:diguanylate cyclase
MMTVLSCLATEHDLRLVLLAAVICIAGSLLSMRLFARVRRSSGGRHFAWLFLASFLAAATIWTTHFTAMLGYTPPVPHAYDPVLTLASLFVAIAMTFIGFLVTARAGTSVLIEVGGAIVGLGVAAMHYTGRAAYRIQGTLEWDPVLVGVSLLLGATFGAVSANRIARPITKFCRYGSTAAFVLAICSMHFTGMGAITLVPGAGEFEASLMPEGVLLVSVIALMALILATGVSIHLIDVQTQNEVIDRYRHLAMHDALTGLPNRTHLAATLDKLTRRPADDTARLGVLAIDLDRFKFINDVHGHAAGDMVLRELTRRLSSILNQDELIARIGGDEFVAVKTTVFVKSELVEFAGRITRAIEEPFAIDEQNLTVGASIGISLFPDDGTTADDLLSRADLAMYRAKGGDGINVRFHDRAMDENKKSRSALAIAMRQALVKGEFELHYQPQNDTASRRLVGFEALLRWNHPERGLVSPGEFIPIAEESGLICDLGEWVLREACREAAGWDRPYRIAVNVAPLQLAQSNLPAIVHGALLETGLAASRLELEITETGIIVDQTHALHVIRQLKNLGVRIAMDDYGTGYSSLATLKSFPFDKIKIDRSFIDGVNSSQQSAAIVRATIILGTSLNIPVLAEGVETEEHLAFLNAEGCKEVQGYFFGKPMPRSAMLELMASVPKDAPATVVETAYEEDRRFVA